MGRRGGGHTYDKTEEEKSSEEEEEGWGVFVVCVTGHEDTQVATR